jgi:hypothetical protein
MFGKNTSIRHTGQQESNGGRLAPWVFGLKETMTGSTSPLPRVGNFPREIVGSVTPSTLIHSKSYQVIPSLCGLLTSHLICILCCWDSAISKCGSESHQRDRKGRFFWLLFCRICHQLQEPGACGPRENQVGIPLPTLLWAWSFLVFCSPQSRQFTFTKAEITTSLCGSWHPPFQRYVAKFSCNKEEGVRFLSRGIIRGTSVFFLS